MEGVGGSAESHGGTVEGSPEHGCRCRTGETVGQPHTPGAPDRGGASRGNGTGQVRQGTAQWI